MKNGKGYAVIDGQRRLAALAIVQTHLSDGATGVPLELDNEGEILVRCEVNQDKAVAEEISLDTEVERLGGTIIDLPANDWRHIAEAA